MALQTFKRGTNNLYRFLRGLSIEILYPISMPPFLPTIPPGSKSISRFLRRREPYHWWVNSILWSVIWESDYDMNRRRRVWHIRNIKVRFKTGVKQTMSSSTFDDDTRDAQTLLEKLQNDPITENIAMELEGTLLAHHNRSKLTNLLQHSCRFTVNQGQYERGNQITQDRMPIAN